MKKKIIDWLMANPKILRWYIHINAKHIARDFCKKYKN